MASVALLNGRFLVLLICLAWSSVSALAEQRVALVVGNSSYRNTAQLRNSSNDAQDIASGLQKFGFEVIQGLDLDKAGLEAKLRQFAQALKGADAGVFFYAGHGLQVGGQNFLIPIDAKLDDVSNLDFETIRLDVVQRIMEREAKTRILFLDACRDNPLARSLARSMGTRSVEVQRGLASIESGVGTLISFSTQPGNVALDGEGRAELALCRRSRQAPREFQRRSQRHPNRSAQRGNANYQQSAGALGAFIIKGSVLLCAAVGWGGDRSRGKKRGRSEVVGDQGQR
jgi:uncharacterized caspase-like protein